MSLSVLDNPGWHALNSHHRHLALRWGTAARYQPNIFGGVALAASDRVGFEDLKHLVAVGEAVGLLGEGFPDGLMDWKSVPFGQLPQMVCPDLQPTAAIEAIELTADDVPEMMALVALTQPGPFLPRTIEMGRYVGVRQDGRLVAMAGERMHLTGFCEISAVCTHPDCRGRGYGGGLTTLVAQGIIARGEVPFLHLAPSNEVAMNLYRRLGFRKRADLPVAFLTRLA